MKEKGKVVVSAFIVLSTFVIARARHDKHGGHAHEQDKSNAIR